METVTYILNKIYNILIFNEHSVLCLIILDVMQLLLEIHV